MGILLTLLGAINDSLQNHCICRSLGHSMHPVVECNVDHITVQLCVLFSFSNPFLLGPNSVRQLTI